MSKKRNRNRRPAHVSMTADPHHGASAGHEVSMANWGIDAARYDEAWGHMPWPLHARDEWDQMDLTTAWQRARQLYINSAPIKAAVEQMVRYTGVLSPLPATTDAEWNKLALSAWCARTKNPHTFDLAGRVNYKQAVRFCERCAIIDGDVCVVPSFASDGGAAFAFYRAPQVSGGGTCGVETDAHLKPMAYYLDAGDGRAPRRLESWKALLYQHNPDPTRLRGYTMLAAALRNAHDLGTIVGYAKGGVKLASTIGLVATKSEKAQGFDIGASVNTSRRRGATEGEQGPKMPTSMPGIGQTVMQLPVGWDMKAISDTRPSQQLQTFWEFLVRSIAQAVGLDPEMLYTTNTLASGGVRFSLAKLRRFQEVMAEDRKVLVNRMWRHVIACEIKAGRLRPCKDPAWVNVRWTQEPDMTIDQARVAQSQINLVDSGMADLEDYCLRTTGRTPLQLAERQAIYLAELKKLAEKYGLTMAELRPRQVGAVPLPAAGADSGSPAALPDDDPEVAVPPRRGGD